LTSVVSIGYKNTFFKHAAKQIGFPWNQCRMTASLDHMSLAVSDITVAVAFFAEAFGFEVAFIERGMTEQIASMLGLKGAECDLAQLALPTGGPRLELITFKPATAGPGAVRPSAPGMAHVAFRTGDFEATLARLRTLGAYPLGDVTTFSQGRAVYLSTPFGAFLELQEARPHGRFADPV
jgi:catechol 2,3-dioxygenase-like lactoylglutathione lyase family enzyme